MHFLLIHFSEGKEEKKNTTLYTTLCMITFVGYPIGCAHFVAPFKMPLFRSARFRKSIQRFL